MFRRKLRPFIASFFALAVIHARTTQLSVSPRSAVLTAGGTVQMSAQTSGSVLWMVNGIDGGNPAIGTISTTGLYTARSSVGSTTSVTVTASTTTKPRTSGSATLTLVAPLAITTSTLPAGTLGTGYDATLAAAGGMAPYSWSLSSGSLPPGLSMTASSGVISGTLSAAGSYGFAILARDTLGNQVARSYSLAVTSMSGVTWGPTYYVDGKNGNDSWSGLLPAPNVSYTDGPFQSIARAQAAMESSSTVKAATLRAGTYSIASIWNLDWADSGELWISYPGEAAVLDGGGTGGVNAVGVSKLKFEGLVFQNMGPTGVYLNGGTQSVTLRWNTFYNCNTSCIRGGGVENSVIDSNTINGQGSAGNSGSAYAAIELWYGSSSNQITHNLIKNCQGGGIAFSAGPTDPPNDNNLVDRNIVRNVNTSTSDNGAIYMMDRSHSAIGNQITNNIMDGNGGSAYQTNWTKAIYLDDLMSNVLVSANLCRNCGQYAWQIHAGDHNNIVNNIFDLSSTGTILGLYQNDILLPDHGMAGNVIERNIVYFSGNPPASLYACGIGPSDVLPLDSNNLYYSATGARVPNGSIILDASPTYANPEFSNPSAGNYSMPLSSPAYSWIGFQALPTDQGPLPYVP